MEQWSDSTPGLVVLPSGLRLRGRSLRRPPDGPQLPTLTVVLSARPPQEEAWEVIWVRWPDFWLPSEPDAALTALRRAHAEAALGRVEVACGGGVGRTGTALAAIAVLDGLPPRAAVELVRRTYHPRAVETPWQRAWLRRRVPR